MGFVKEAVADFASAKGSLLASSSGRPLAAASGSDSSRLRAGLVRGCGSANAT